MRQSSSSNVGTIPDVPVEFPYGRSDKDIWGMFKNGHEGAFKYIYETYYSHLHKFGHRITSDSDLVKDCIQDTFIELRNGKKIADVDSIKFYLLKTLKNKLQKALKRQHSLVYFSRQESFEHFDVELSEEVKLINLQMDEENKKQIRYLLSKLTKKQKQALYYFYYEDLSYKEIAALMDLSHVRSARNLIYKALSSIRPYLKIVSLLLAAAMSFIFNN